MQPFQTHLQQVLAYLKGGGKTQPAAGVAAIPNTNMPKMPISAPPVGMQQVSVPMQGVPFNGR